MKIALPNPQKKRALIVVDVQAPFINEHNQKILPNIAKVIKKGKYIAIVEVVFSTEKNPLWEKQDHWTCPFSDTLEQIKKLLPDTQNKVYVHKSTKSAWKGDKDLLAFFKKLSVEEIHIVGLDTNDCVLATAYESFDLGFQTYVIEEATHASGGSNLKGAAIEILRNVDLTNHSEFIEEKILI